RRKPNHESTLLFEGGPPQLGRSVAQSPYFRKEKKRGAVLKRPSGIQVVPCTTREFSDYVRSTWCTGVLSGVRHLFQPIDALRCLPPSCSTHRRRCIWAFDSRGWP